MSKLAVRSNIPLQATVKKLRFLTSAELARWAFAGESA